MEKIKEISISIIIPSYNTDRLHLDRCLRSILSQKFNNYEIILVDDGSTIAIDETLSEKFKRDARVVIIRQNNSGASIARNTGLIHAKGKYITFVDADDCMAKGWLEYSYNVLEKNIADAVFAKVVMCNEDNLDQGGNDNYDIQEITFVGKEILNIQRMLLENDKPPISNMEYVDLGQCGKLFRSDSIQNVKFPEGIKLSEDQVFLHKILNKCSRIIISNKIAYYYIYNPKSTSHTNQPFGAANMKKAMDMISELLLNKEELLESFSFRVVNDILLGIYLQFFYQPINNLSFFEKYQKISRELDVMLYIESLQRIKISRITGYREKVKFCLLKRFDLLYFLIMEIKLKRQ